MARRSTHPEEVPQGVAGKDLATIGAKFRAAREKQGWAIEDVSRILRLRPTILREVENDDLGSFTHASYARLSLLGYARLLGVPEDEIRSWLPAKGDLSSGEFTYLDQLQNPEPAARREDFAEQRMPRRNPLETLLKIAAAVLLLLGATYAYIIWHNLGRLQGGATEGTDAPQEVMPIPLPVIEIQSTAEPIAETPFQLAPLDRPTPFLEQDALALDIQIPVDKSQPGLSDDEDSTTAGIAGGPEVRAAIPLEAEPVTDPVPSDTTP